MDPYKILGLNKKATAKEIKDSYRKLALEKHPDKVGGSKEEFQKISEAYEILSDPQSKQKFDNGGNHQGHKIDFSQFRTASDIFGSGFSTLFTTNREPVVKRTPDKKHEIKLSLEDMYNGKTSKFAITRSVKCNSCEGNGGTEKSQKPCVSCGGRGFRNMYSGRGIKTIQCMQCDSQGTSNVFGKPCKKCTTSGHVKERVVVEAIFPKGCPNGFKIVKEGMSDYKEGRETGDIVIIAKQKEHEFFKRIGRNLICTIELTFSESICGFKKTITHLDNRPIEISSKDVTMNGDKIKIPGEGMIKGSSGLLEINIIVQRPTKLSCEDIEGIKKILEDK